MRLSLSRASTLFLLALWAATHSTDGAPTSLASRGSFLNDPINLAVRAGAAKGPGKSPGKIPDDKPDDKPDESPASSPSKDPSTPGGADTSAPAPGKVGTTNPASGVGTASGSSKPPVDNAFDNTKYDYIKEPKPEENDPVSGTYYSVFTKNFEKGGDPIDEIFINTDKDSLTVKAAWNRQETVSDPARKLTLSDIEMSLWKQAGKDPKDLEIVYHQTVMEKDAGTQVLMSDLRTEAGVSDDATVTYNSGSNEFNQLMNTPFPKGINRMIQQYGIGKKITKFDSVGEEDDAFFGLTVYLG